MVSIGVRTLTMLLTAGMDDPQIANHEFFRSRATYIDRLASQEIESVASVIPFSFENHTGLMSVFATKAKFSLRNLVVLFFIVYFTTIPALPCGQYWRRST